MTDVDLELVGKDDNHRWLALRWVVQQYGSAESGLWKLKGLQHICFKEPKHATHFILKWS
jgi:hypothetical protein